MKEKGWKKDAQTEVYKEIMNSDILVLGTPIWLGEKSSECTKIIERLYSNSSKLNDKGQYAYYYKVGGCLITGNEDGGTMRNEHLIFFATNWIHNTSSSKCILSRRSRSWPTIPRRKIN